MQDYVNEIGGELETRVMVGGIRGWVQAYEGSMMDGYGERSWQAEERWRPEKLGIFAPTKLPC